MTPSAPRPALTPEALDVSDYVRKKAHGDCPICAEMYAASCNCERCERLRWWLAFRAPAHQPPGRTKRGKGKL